jgi:hypothetical protein
MPLEIGLPGHSLPTSTCGPVGSKHRRESAPGSQKRDIAPRSSDSSIAGDHMTRMEKRGRRGGKRRAEEKRRREEKRRGDEKGRDEMNVRREEKRRERRARGRGIEEKREKIMGDMSREEKRLGENGGELKWEATEDRGRAQRSTFGHPVRGFSAISLSFHHIFPSSPLLSIINPTLNWDEHKCCWKWGLLAIACQHGRVVFSASFHHKSHAELG